MSYKDLETSTQTIQEAKRVKELLSPITDKDYKGKLEKYFSLLYKVKTQWNYILSNSKEVEDNIVEIRKSFPNSSIKHFGDLFDNFCNYRLLALAFFERGEIEAAHRKLLVLHVFLRQFYVPESSLLERL